MPVAALGQGAISLEPRRQLLTYHARGRVGARQGGNGCCLVGTAWHELEDQRAVDACVVNESERQEHELAAEGGVEGGRDVTVAAACAAQREVDGIVERTARAAITAGLALNGAREVASRGGSLGGASSGETVERGLGVSAGNERCDEAEW